MNLIQLFSKIKMKEIKKPLRFGYHEKGSEHRAAGQPPYLHQMMTPSTAPIWYRSLTPPRSRVQMKQTVWNRAGGARQLRAEKESCRQLRRLLRQPTTHTQIYRQFLRWPAARQVVCCMSIVGPATAAEHAMLKLAFSKGPPNSYFIPLFSSLVTASQNIPQALRHLRD